MHFLVLSVFLFTFETLRLDADPQRRIHAMETRCYIKIHYTTDHVTNKEVQNTVQRAIRPTNISSLLSKKQKISWYRHASCSTGLAKTILQGMVRGSDRQERHYSWIDRHEPDSILKNSRGQEQIEENNFG